MGSGAADVALEEGPVLQRGAVQVVQDALAVVRVGAGLVERVEQAHVQLRLVVEGALQVPDGLVLVGDGDGGHGGAVPPAGLKGPQEVERALVLELVVHVGPEHVLVAGGDGPAAGAGMVWG